MLFRSQAKLKRPLSFPTQLSCLKEASSLQPDAQKQHQSYELTQNILSLLIDKTPQITQQLLIVKTAINKWYQHVKQEQINKNREIVNYKEYVIVKIKKEVGIVLEEIAYYLRSIMEQYHDKNIEKYYVKYLLALKKLQWGSPDQKQNKPQTSNKQIQTMIDQHSFELSDSQPLGNGTSITTIQSPRKKYKDLDVHKYLQTKQENLFLQKQNNRINLTMNKLQEQNNKLKQEVCHLFRTNQQFKQNQQKYIDDVAELSRMLEDIKKGEEEKRKREKEEEINWQQTKNKYNSHRSIKDNIYRQLDQAEQTIKNKEKEINKRNAQEYFSLNYRLSHDQSFTLSELEEANLYRFVLTQAIGIQDLLTSQADRL